MTRAEFDAFLARTLWRDGDDVLEGDIQYLVKMAENRLDRDLDVTQRLAFSTLSATDRRLTLPDDYSHTRVLSESGGDQEYRYVTPFQMEKLRTAGYDLRSGREAAYYTFTDTIETLREGSTENPIDFDLQYYAKVPAFTDAETWVQRDYFDLYTFACLSFSAPYLREDPRLQVWETQYAGALESAKQDDAGRKYNGSPLRPRLPGVVA